MEEKFIVCQIVALQITFFGFIVANVDGEVIAKLVKRNHQPLYKNNGLRVAVVRDIYLFCF